jgi:hypothetical protein
MVAFTIALGVVAMTPGSSDEDVYPKALFGITVGREA